MPLFSFFSFFFFALFLLKKIPCSSFQSGLNPLRKEGSIFFIFILFYIIRFQVMRNDGIPLILFHVAKPQPIVLVPPNGVMGLWSLEAFPVWAECLEPSGREYGSIKKKKVYYPRWERANLWIFSQGEKITAKRKKKSITRQKYCLRPSDPDPNNTQQPRRYLELLHFFSPRSSNLKKRDNIFLLLFSSPLQILQLTEPPLCCISLPFTSTKQ